MIDKEIYDKAFDLRERLNKDFNGYSYDLVICYTLTEAIENLKKEMEDKMKKTATKKVKKVTKTSKKK